MHEAEHLRRRPDICATDTRRYLVIYLQLRPFFLFLNIHEKIFKKATFRLLPVRYRGSICLDLSAGLYIFKKAGQRKRYELHAPGIKPCNF